MACIDNFVRLIHLHEHDLRVVTLPPGVLNGGSNTSLYSPSLYLVSVHSLSLSPLSSLSHLSLSLLSSPLNLNSFNSFK